MSADPGAPEQSTATVADLYKQGVNLLKDFKHREARQIFKEVITKLKGAEDVPSLSRMACTLVKIGCIDDVTGKWQKATQNLERGLSIAKKSQDQSSILNCMLALARLEWEKGNIQSAETRASEALTMAEALGEEVLLARCGVTLATVLSKRGQREKAMEFLTRSEDTVKRHMDRPEALAVMGAITNQQGIFHFKTGDQETALDTFRRSCSLLSKMGPSKELGEALRYMGIIFSIRRDHLNTLTNLLEALRTYKAMGYIFGIGKINNSLGQTFLSMQELDRALYFFGESGKRYVQVKAKPDLAGIYSKIGHVYMKKGSPGLAIQYYLKDLRISSELENKHGLAYTYKNLGSAYRLQGEGEQVLTFYMKSLELFREFQDPMNEAEIHRELALTYLDIGDLEEALSSANDAAKIYETNNVLNELATTMMLQGTIFRTAESPEKAEEFFSQSRSFFEETKDYAKLTKCLYEIGLLQLSQGEKEQAMTLFSKSIEMAESLNLDDLISANLTEIEKLDEEMVISLSIDKLRHSRKDLDTQR